MLAVYDPAFPLLGVYPRETRADIHATTSMDASQSNHAEGAKPDHRKVHTV